VDVAPTTEAQVYLAPQLSQVLIPPSGFVAPVGTPLLEPAISWGQTAALQQLQRAGMGWPVTAQVLADPGPAARSRDQPVRRFCPVALEQQMLNAPAGAAPRWTGILNTPGIGSVTKGDGAHSTETDFDAIHRAVTVVRNLGFYAEPVDVVMHPTTI